MEGKSELTIQEKIIAVQKQFRIAIQNHQVLVGKLQMLQNRDEQIKVHLEVIQCLILSMGKTQASLLNQFRNEIAAKYDLKPNSTTVSNIIKKLLAFPEAPKHIPVYKRTSTTGDNENKKLSSWKPKLMKSVLKVNNKDTNDVDKTKLAFSNKLNGTSLTTIDGSKIKIVYNKKKDGSSVLIQQPKKLQSVLKSKNIKVSPADKAEKAEEGRQSPESISSTCSGDLKGKDGLLLNENINVEQIDLTESPPSQNKMDTRYGKKYEAKLMGNTKIKILCDQNQPSKRDPLCEVELKESCTPHWTPGANSRVTRIRRLDQNPTFIDELDQETFLSIFRLVSIEKCEMLKRKRCERKRRSVAGQSSLYSDYFQPQPKRTYTPRKPVVPVTNNNAIIVESPVADDDEDEKAIKAEVCIVCHEEGDLEVCNSCSEMFHFGCIPSPQKGNCPSCMAQSTNIPNIVGANNAVGNASNLELIKRYSNDELAPDNNEKKHIENGHGGK